MCRCKTGRSGARRLFGCSGLIAGCIRVPSLVPARACSVRASARHIAKRLGRIWSSPYVGQWVISSVLWCSASAEDAVRLISCYATSSAQVLCTTQETPYARLIQIAGYFLVLLGV